MKTMIMVIMATVMTVQAQIYVPEIRTWTAKSGQMVEAWMIAQDSKSVSLSTTNGSINVSKSYLTNDDLEYLKRQPNDDLKPPKTVKPDSSRIRRDHKAMISKASAHRYRISTDPLGTKLIQFSKMKFYATRSGQLTLVSKGRVMATLDPDKFVDALQMKPSRYRSGRVRMFYKFINYRNGSGYYSKKQAGLYLSVEGVQKLWLNERQLHRLIAALEAVPYAEIAVLAQTKEEV